MKKRIFLFACVSFLRLSGEVCNGDEAFCDKRYNEIFGRLRMHNAASYFDSRTWFSLWQSSFFGLYPNPVADQSISFQEQLVDAQSPHIYPRIFKFPLHPVEDHGKRVTWITHTLSNREFNAYFDKYANFLSFFPALKDSIRNFIIKTILWRVDATNMPFVDALRQLKTFLDTNTNEVVTLYLNVFDLTLVEIVESFEASGISSYIHVQDKEQLWPTLRELIAANKRLIVFQDEYRIAENLSSDESIQLIVYDKPWVRGFLFGDDFVFGNQWGQITLEDLKNDSCDIVHDDYIRNQAAYQNRNNPANKIFDLSHTVTPGMAGDKEVADYANRYDVLLEHIVKCYASLGMLPNTITLDFYDVARSDVNAIQQLLASSDGFFVANQTNRHLPMPDSIVHLPDTCPANLSAYKEEL